MNNKQNGVDWRRALSYLVLLLLSLTLIFAAISSEILAEGDAATSPETAVSSGGNFTLVASTTAGGSTTSGGIYNHSGVIGEGYGSRMAGGSFAFYSGYQSWLDYLGTLYMPIILNNYSSLPDLIVEEIIISSTDIQVTIRNIGSGSVADDFWVDTYINPTVPPTGVNQTWVTQGGEGLVWGVTNVILASGESLTLSPGDTYYTPAASNFSGSIAPGSIIYAQVDSANTATTYGNVLENHEATGDAYNNIMQITAATAVSLSASTPLQRVSDQFRLMQLPER